MWDTSSILESKEKTVSASLVDHLWSVDMSLSV